MQYDPLRDGHPKQSSAAQDADANTLAAHVAGGLSERQREALLWLPADGSDADCMPSNVTEDVLNDACEFASFGVDVCNGVVAYLADEDDDGLRITPFGTRVRALVAKEAGGE